MRHLEPVNSMHTDDYDGATTATFDEHAHDADSGAYPRSQVAQMYSGSGAESNAASGTPASHGNVFSRARRVARRLRASPIEILFGRVEVSARSR